MLTKSLHNVAPNNWAEHLTVGKEKYYINSFYERLVRDLVLDSGTLLLHSNLDVMNRLARINLTYRLPSSTNMLEHSLAGIG